jgi:hypothetical protein
MGLDVLGAIDLVDVLHLNHVGSPCQFDLLSCL